MKAFVVAAALAVLATPAFAVDYLVHDQDGHGTTKCEFSQAVQVDIVGFDYSAGDRTFMCLAPKPPRVFHGGNGGGNGGIYALVKEIRDAANTPDPVTPDPVDPDPVDPDPVDPDPVDPDPEPGDCQRVSDCPIEPDPKPCERKVDCVGPAPDPEPTGPRLCNAKGECRP